MLSRGWCEKLREKGYPQVLPYNDWDGRKVAYQDENHAGIVAATETELLHSLVVAVIPSGDELLAECVKLLDDGEWIERVLQAANGTMVGRVCIKSLLFISGHPDIHFEGKAGLTNNSDLADAWLWLNERKKRNG